MCNLVRAHNLTKRCFQLHLARLGSVSLYVSHRDKILIVFVSIFQPVIVDLVTEDDNPVVFHCCDMSLYCTWCCKYFYVVSACTCMLQHVHQGLHVSSTHLIGEGGCGMVSSECWTQWVHGALKGISWVFWQSISSYISTTLSLPYPVHLPPSSVLSPSTMPPRPCAVWNSTCDAILLKVLKQWLDSMQTSNGNWHTDAWGAAEKALLGLRYIVGGLLRQAEAVRIDGRL